MSAHKLKAIPSFKHTAAMGPEADEIPRCQKLRVAPSFKHIVEESAAEISREGSEVEGLVPRYMSLKDVMANLSPTGGAAAPEPGEIAIRNELVKHAASAYVLSATVMISPANRDQDSRMKMCCVGFINHILHRIRAGLLT